ncbi:MAG: DNA cytosine methyltransferase, partial [Flavobacteriaceae bacterium]|nr:DNA cytosine methyltransferase [Flavobacteriaceae bacterium]
MIPKAISLFCGAGGCSLGFKQAGYSILYANDKDKSAVSTYKKNFPETICTEADIDDLDFNKILMDLKIKTKEIDILIGGPPCQGFSTAGRRFWDDPRNRLLKSYINALETIKPKWFIMENVEGLLTSNKGIYVYEAIKAFIELGYQVRLEKIYCQEYGVPQRRKRVFIVGNRLGINFLMPKPTIKISGQIFRNSNITISHAIDDLPQATVFNNNEIMNTTDHYYPALNDLQSKRIMALKCGQTMKDLPENLQHYSFNRRANRRVADGTPTEKRGGSPSGIKRLVPTEPCLTITGASTRE